MSYKKKILYGQFFLTLTFVIVLFPLIKKLTNVALVGVLPHSHQAKKVLDIAILGICLGLLAIHGAIIMFMIHKVMSPVQHIIEAIKSYKEGKEEFLPQISLTKSSAEFTQLASTINSLNERIRKQIDFLTRQKEETEEILESIGEGIVAVDTSARVIFANQSACKILGIAKEAMIGKTLEGVDTKKKEILKKCHELIVHALQTVEPAGHTWIEREKGAFYYDLIAAPLAHKHGVLLVLQDKTSDYRIVELGKDFISNASHELKTPITIIRGFAETLNDMPDLSKEMLHQITERIVKTCGRLDKLVHSLLTLTDIEQASAKNFSKIDLICLLCSCVEMLVAVYPEAKVGIESDSFSAEVFGDGSLIELAIMNILENAVRYSHETADIKIRVSSMKETVRIQFEDQGIGISENDLPQIFERFYTVDKARSRKKGGAGLGLSIVKTVLEKHQGKVFATSELGKGSLFVFMIPKNRCQ